LPQETWLSYRKIIQAWDESICKVSAKDLPKADYDMLAEAVLTSNHIDAEIICMLNRRPRVFHLRMLPTCSVEVGSDEVAADIAKAHVEASAAKLKLFEADFFSCLTGSPPVTGRRCPDLPIMAGSHKFRLPAIILGFQS
jgi:hypothetical protein